MISIGLSILTTTSNRTEPSEQPLMPSGQLFRRCGFREWSAKPFPRSVTALGITPVSSLGRFLSYFSFFTYLFPCHFRTITHMRETDALCYLCDREELLMFLIR